MVEIFKILSVAIITVFAVILTRQIKPEIAMIIILVGGILVVSMMIGSINSAFKGFSKVFEQTNVNSTLLVPLFKIIAIGYIAEFGANLCVDAGVSSIADKILFSAKIIILIISLPIITSVVEMISGLM